MVGLIISNRIPAVEFEGAPQFHISDIYPGLIANWTDEKGPLRKQKSVKHRNSANGCKYYPSRPNSQRCHFKDQKNSTA